MVYPLDYKQIIPIGVQTSTGFDVVKWDIASWLDNYPDAEIALLVRRPDQQSYFGDVEVKGKTVIWHISGSDTAVKGFGKAELILYSGDVQGLSHTYRIFVQECMSELAVKDPPAPVQGWVNDILDAAEAVQKAKESIDEDKQFVADAKDEVEELANEINTNEPARVEAENKRVEAENSRVEAEEARVEAEKLRSQAETGRASAEETRNTQESERVEAENLRKSSEESRAQAESTRVNAENLRNQAETKRVEAETARVEAENSRVKAEAARASEESKRVEAEDSRASAETERVSAEETRKTSESTRVSNETARVNSENTRVSQENARKSSEEARAKAEDARKTSEEGRVNQENARKTAEEARVEAENTRASNESAREANETARESEWDTLKETIETNEESRQSEWDTLKETIETNEASRESEWTTLKADAQSATNAANQAAEEALDAADSITGTYAPLSSTVQVEESGNPTLIKDTVPWGFQGMSIYGKSTQDGTPSPESPVPIVSAGDGGSIEVLVTGKNLLDISNMQQNNQNGITFSLENGGIKISGTATADTDSPVFRFRLPAGTYISNVNRTRFPWLSSANYVVEKKDGGSYWLNTGLPFTISDEDVGKYFYFIVHKGKTVNEIIYPQIEVGSIATPYEPYRSQSLTISTPNGLPGIPVSSGGNYTDEDGQQWVCDEVNLGRGVYVKRILKQVLNGSEEWYTWGVDFATSGFTGFYRYNRDVNDPVSNFIESGIKSLLCNLFGYEPDIYGGTKIGVYYSPNDPVTNLQYIIVGISNSSLNDISSSEAAVYSFKQLLQKTNMIVYAPLATPIENPLTPEQIAAYKALKANQDYTTVISPDEVGIKAKAVVDPVKYIDRKLSAIGSTIMEVN